MPKGCRNLELWHYNFLVSGNVAFAVEVVAAERNGWRVHVGVLPPGRAVINKPMFTQWHRTFGDAVKSAKSQARRLGIRWKPAHYATEKVHKPGTAPG